MTNHASKIISQIGETDQRYLQGNTPELVLERADLRLQLVTISQVKQEQLHFLHEAIVLLEQGLIEFEKMPMSLYVNLSLHLAKSYMMYYELNHEDKYALVTQQVLKPLVHQNNADVFLFLAYAAISRKESALTQHWLKKYAKTEGADLELLKQHHAFIGLHQELWFIQLTKTLLH